VDLRQDNFSSILKESQDWFPCVALWPYGLQKTKPPMDILQELAVNYWLPLKRKSLEAIFQNKKEVEETLYEYIAAKSKGNEIYSFLKENFDDIKRVKLKGLPCQSYLWCFYFCPGSCIQGYEKYQGVGFKIISITELKTEPPRYKIKFKDKSKILELTVNEFLSFSTFQKLYYRHFHEWIKKPVDWDKALNFIGRRIKRKKIPFGKLEEFDETDLIYELRYWVNTINTENTLEVLLWNKPIFRDGTWMAKGEALYEKLRTFGGRQKVFSILRNVFGFRCKVVSLEGKKVRVWVFPKTFFKKGKEGRVEW